MAELNYVTGDATKPQGTGHKFIIHCCNDAGAWGSGFVLAISKQWLKPEAAYKDWFRGVSQDLYAPFKLGYIQPVQVTAQISVVNMLGQHGCGKDENNKPPIRYDAIDACLYHTRIHARHNDYMQGCRCTSVHCPRFGAGLAGGDWDVIEYRIRLQLVNHGINVTVYDFERGA